MISLEKPSTTTKTVRHSSPWRWIPTLYFGEGLPYTIVITVTVVMYKRLGLDNESIALYTSWFNLPWVIKPFWSPVVEIFKTKRWWILLMELFIGTAIAGVAFTLPLSANIQWTMAFFWLMAFSSATHDIAADGYYMIQLSSHDQALYVGIRSTFYRIALIAGSGLLLMIAGLLEVYTQIPERAWSLTFAASAVIFLALCFYHVAWLPRPQTDVEQEQGNDSRIRQLWLTFVSFFKKPHIVAALAFMLLYRLPEALLTKICPLFLLDKPRLGGLGLTTSALGLVQGTIGIIGLTLGGILGGIVIARDGFGRWLWPMVASISLPNAVYIILAYFQPESVTFIASCIFVEQFGYGFGFTAYMLYLIHFSQGALKTAHYAFCTGFMALSMMLPGMVAGWLQESVGYLNFFIIVMALIPVTFIVSAFIKVEADFGKKG